MLKNNEILSLAYQRQAGGDARPIAEIVAQIRQDAAALSLPQPGADDVAARGETCFADGSVERWTVYGDGRRVTE